MGEGLTSQVRRVRKDNQEYAMKIFKPTYSVTQIKKEIEILSQITHHNIVQYVDGKAEERFIVTEILQNMDLFDLLAKKQQPFSLASTKYIGFQLTAAIQYIHKCGFIHRDIKLENILIDKHLTIKICDFGFAESIQGGLAAKSSGTLGYLAPELQCAGYIRTEQLPCTDIFSLGVCIFMLQFAHPPFRSSSKSCPYWRLINSLQWEKYWTAVDKTKKCDDNFKTLIQGMLEPNPTKRMTIEEVLEHPYWIGGDKEEYCQEVWERLKLE